MWQPSKKISFSYEQFFGQRKKRMQTHFLHLVQSWHIISLHFHNEDNLHKTWPEWNFSQWEICNTSYNYQCPRISPLGGSGYGLVFCVEPQQYMYLLSTGSINVPNSSSVFEYTAEFITKIVNRCSSLGSFLQFPASAQETWTWCWKHIKSKV